MYQLQSKYAPIHPKLNQSNLREKPRLMKTVDYIFITFSFNSSRNS